MHGPLKNTLATNRQSTQSSGIEMEDTDNGESSRMSQNTHGRADACLFILRGCDFKYYHFNSISFGIFHIKRHDLTGRNNPLRSAFRKHEQSDIFFYMNNVNE